MSYSFSVRATSKTAALALAVEKFKGVIASQPVHELDESAAQKAREEACTLLSEPTEGNDFYISCSGSLSWQGNYPDGHRITGASIQVYASHQPVEKKT